eukprot:sb/3464086/
MLRWGPAPPQHTRRTDKPTNKHKKKRVVIPDPTHKQTRHTVKQFNKVHHDDKQHSTLQGQVAKPPPASPGNKDVAVSVSLLKDHLQALKEERQKERDRQRDMVKTFLLFKLYQMMQRMAARHHGCEEHYVNIHVAAKSPAFGGVYADMSSSYVSNFNILDWDNTMSRVELYGCSKLMKGPREDLVPDTELNPRHCGGGTHTLLWAWYNGQSVQNLPPNTGVHVGYDADVHFLVARLVKFYNPNQYKNTISLRPKDVKVTFRDCFTKPKFRQSNYQFHRTVSRPSNTHTLFNVDTRCQIGAGFMIYGVYTDLGQHGKSVILWRNNQTAITNTKRVKSRDMLVTRITDSHQIHTFDTPIRIQSGEVLKVRCQFDYTPNNLPPVITPYRAQSKETCLLTLLIMIPTDREGQSVGQCSTPAHFGDVSAHPNLDTWAAVVGVFFTTHPYLITLVIMATVLVAMVMVRLGWQGEEGGRMGRRHVGEMDGLMDEYDDIDNATKMK